jgi:hypothetical protein
VELCHTSLRDFLTTESRSECFFVSPSFHLYLFYRCSVVVGGVLEQAAYPLLCLKEHIEQFTRLPPSAQRLPRFPETLDALYSDILAKAQNLPHFSGIISTIALISKLLPMPEIAELLGVTVSQVAEVLDRLREVFDSARRWSDEADTLSVTFRHASLLDFLTTESRSGPFYVPPSFHRFLFDRYLILWSELCSKEFVSGRMNCSRWSPSHLDKYLAAISAEDTEHVTRASS